MENSTANWQGLVAAAILGAERAGAPDLRLGAQAGALLNRENEGDATAHMLQSAAILSAYDRAGRQPADRGKVELPQAPAEILPPCSDAAARILREIISGDLFGILLEWCELAAAAGQRVSDEILPAFLQAIITRDSGLSFEDSVVAVLGAKGRWLAKLNPEWSIRLPETGDLDAVWERGEFLARINALQEIRRTDPDRGRKLLEEVWAQETAPDLPHLLHALHVGLSAADEAFLESRLDVATAAIRQMAADLLIHLPESAYAGRMKKRGRALLTLTGKKGLVRNGYKLEVNLPGSLDKPLRRDGMSAVKQPGMGKKASLLFEILRRTPLSCWDTADAAAWILAASASEWDQPILKAWAEAAAQQQDQAWAHALLDHFVGQTKSRQKLKLYRDSIAKIVPLADPERLEALAAAPFKRGDHDVVVILLAGCKDPWSLDFSRQVLTWLTKGLSKGMFSYGGPRAELRGDYARLISPEVLPEVLTGFAKDTSGLSTALQETIESFTRTLQARAALRKEFSL